MVPVSARAQAALRLFGRFLLDGVAPVLLPLLLVREVGAALLSDPAHTVAAPMYVVTGDGNGEAWFYWWFARAFHSGVSVDLPNVVCAPAGIPLGNNFPTRIDAWLALPFFDRLPFPQSFNTVAMAVPVVNAWFSWLGLRAIRAPLLPALLGALVLGFAEYVLHEVNVGHNANALIGPPLLFLGAWSAVAEGRWRWAPVAAFAGALTMAAYPPYAVAVLPVAATFGLAGLLAHRAQRREILGGGAFVAIAVGGAALTLAHDLAARGYSRQAASALRDSWSQLLTDSLPLDWIGRVSPDFRGPHTWFAPLLLLGLLAGLFGGWRGRGWVAAAAWFWLLTLGILVLQRTDAGVNPWKPAGSALALPLYGAIEAWPSLAGVRPYRFSPLVLGAAVFALGAWAGRPPKTPVRGVGSLLAATLLLVAGLYAARVGDHLRLRAQPWIVPEAVKWLATQPGDAAIVELPMGMGHAYAPWQLVHGKARAEGHHDVPLSERESATAPSACYTNTLVRALWGLDHGVPLPEERASMVQEASAAGYGYVVVYPRVYATLPGRQSAAAGVISRLTAAFGVPVNVSADAVIFELPR